MTWHEEQERLKAEPSDWSRADAWGRVGLALGWAVKALLLFIVIGGTFAVIAIEAIGAITGG